MTAPLVSVLIPCFNAAPYIGATLESVLAQTYRPIEVIVVDDGSTDGSAQVVGAYAASGVRLVPANCQSAAKARNLAFGVCAGEFILYLDADDFISPDHVASLITRVGEAPRSIAFGRWGRFANDPEAANFVEPAHYRDSPGVDWLCADWIGGQAMTQCGAFLIPRQIIEQAGGWDERLNLIDDFEFFARVLLTAERLVYAPGARLHYRSGVSGSLSGQTSRKAAESAYLSLLQGTGHLLAVEDSDRTRRACATVLQNFEFEFYPAHSDLRRPIRRRIAELGGVDALPSGPPGFHALRRWIGWRAARRVQHLAEQLGLNRAARQTGQG